MLGHVVIAAVFELLAVTLLVASFSRPAGAKAKAMPSHGAIYVAALICFLVGATPLHRSTEAQCHGDGRYQQESHRKNRPHGTPHHGNPPSRIESVVVDEPAVGRILGYGTVIVRGTGGTPEIFEKIQHP